MRVIHSDYWSLLKISTVKISLLLLLQLYSKICKQRLIFQATLKWGLKSKTYSNIIIHKLTNNL